MLMGWPIHGARRLKAELAPVQTVGKPPQTIRRRPAGHLRIGLALLAIPFLVAVIPSVISTGNGVDMCLSDRLQPASWRHPCGTDDLGRDVFLRSAIGARWSLLSAVLVVALSAVIGVSAGSLSGFSAGIVDRSIQLVLDLVQSFPGILLALALVTLLGPGRKNLVVALIFTGWIGYARLSRSLTIGLRSSGYIEAQKAIGSTRWHIIVRHVIPNITGPIIVLMALHLPSVVLAEGTLSFLGMGAPPPQASWGSMIDEGRRHLLDQPSLILFPGFLLMMTLMGMSLAGEALSEGLDPRRDSKG